jgi:hypothetical protein
LHHHGVRKGAPVAPVDTSAFDVDLEAGLGLGVGVSSAAAWAAIEDGGRAVFPPLSPRSRLYGVPDESPKQQQQQQQQEETAGPIAVIVDNGVTSPAAQDSQAMSPRPFPALTITTLLGTPLTSRRGGDDDASVPSSLPGSVLPDDGTIDLDSRFGSELMLATGGVDGDTPQSRRQQQQRQQQQQQHGHLGTDSPNGTPMSRRGIPRPHNVAAALLSHMDGRGTSSPLRTLKMGSLSPMSVQTPNSIADASPLSASGLSLSRGTSMTNMATPLIPGANAS